MCEVVVCFFLGDIGINVDGSRVLAMLEAFQIEKSSTSSMPISLRLGLTMWLGTPISIFIGVDGMPKISEAIHANLKLLPIRPPTWREHLLQTFYRMAKHFSRKNLASNDWLSGLKFHLSQTRSQLADVCKSSGPRMNGRARDPNFIIIGAVVGDICVVGCVLSVQVVQWVFWIVEDEAGTGSRAGHEQNRHETDAWDGWRWRHCMSLKINTSSPVLFKC